MGRPLFSQTHTPAAPAVRVEPEQTQPYERWTYWNPFDPDSEEFFANAELETPVEVVQGEDTGRVTPVVVEVESSSSSSASSSGRGSPTQADLDEQDLAVEEVNTRIRRGVAAIRRLAAHSSRSVPDSAYTYRATADRSLRAATASSPIFPPTPPLATPALSPTLAHASAPADRDAFTVVEQDFEYFDRESVVPTTAPVLRPTTPTTPPPSTPRLGEDAMLQPSPPPSVTPRLYTWSAVRDTPAGAPPASPTPAPARANLQYASPPRRWTPRYATYTPASASPSSSSTAMPSAASSSSSSTGSPLPNLGARMSVAHITPSITSGRIRV